MITEKRWDELMQVIEQVIDSLKGMTVEEDEIVCTALTMYITNAHIHVLKLENPIGFVDRVQNNYMDAFGELKKHIQEQEQMDKGEYANASSKSVDGIQVASDELLGGEERGI